MRQIRCTTTPLLRSIRSLSRSSSSDKIVASVLFERLPVIIPKIDPVVYAFQEFSFQWKQQYRRTYPDEFYKKYESRGKGDYQIDYKPGSRVTEADKSNDKRQPLSLLVIRNLLKLVVQTTLRSLQRALDRRLFLLLHWTSYGSPDEKPVWHFPEKVYENEETPRKCAESAL
ncbi:hypothetical protein BVRB_6g132790 isoform B [Beta vulgaris subsp. vulgaris]|nr:hypothetical protein BVRB_6g132790 isoform B [Beta vulgaris subsp. vulgaris]